ncbi:alkaline phosphatase family protein [Paraglaciecola sp. L3A3]|uniref:alkaline phosphatase family protein n=1 Tax=Paraglaciecola sp. L3A3 TaxID=2686358 RepID=UPI00131D58C9|nr:alkaline phosphatase family protein [Paraglaciecola sp. L3A3]
MKYLLIILMVIMTAKVYAADNLVIVSIDGLRWQEVFRGYQDDVLNLAEFDKQKTGLEQQFSGQNDKQKRSNLMPFLWSDIAKKGAIIGNRDLNSNMSVTNELWFSYPGYNEILTGRADPRIDSNKAKPNPNVTILEWLNQQQGYQGKVVAFGSWDVFPAIINRDRSKLMINAGFESATWSQLSEKSAWLNQLQTQIPSPWHNVRLDAFTHGFAVEYIKSYSPKVIYLALGETDDFAHQGNYPEYIRGANRSDKLIAALWHQLQLIPQYKNNTNLLITVDHGRGENAETWQHHASAKAVKGYLNGLNKFPQGIVGADQVWLAAMGPDVKNLGEVSKNPPYYLNQVAATALQLLGIDGQSYAKDIGKALPITHNK